MSLMEEEVRLAAARSLPTRLMLDDADSPRDVIDALILSPFTLGDQPWAMTRHLDRVRPDAALLPPGARLLRASREENGPEARLACGDGWTLRVVRWKSGSATVTVTAVTEDLAGRVLAEATADVTEPEPEAEHVRMGFWWCSPHGARNSVKPITTSPWPDIRRNYSAAARRELDRVMALSREALAGRLLLLHGPPGTGKTTLLRTLAHEWRSWCQVDCVVDPERLFGDPGYLMEVAVAEEGRDDEPQRRWRMLVLEDCDELIRAEAKESSGQGLSRLLNLTDGLFGQGRDVLVAITTNEPVNRLHPAVVRPGRCLAQIEVGPLSHREAVDWLGTAEGVPAGGATLAELYALRLGSLAAPAGPRPEPGLYL